jgi:hypothetical protein
MENNGANQNNRKHTVKESHGIRPAEEPHQGSNPRLSAKLQWQAGTGQSQHTDSSQNVNPAMQRSEPEDRVVQSPVGQR